jgi:glycosyltransferase involved in cell wall biosynthesis
VRVLHLTPELPCWPGGTGGATRQYHLLRRLAELGHEVTVVAPVPGDAAEAAADLERVGIRLRAASRPGSRVREGLAAIGRRPALPALVPVLPVLAWQVSVFWTALRAEALAEVDRRRPDVIAVEHDNAAHWIADLPADVPAALTLHNLGPGYYRSRAAAASGARRAWLAAEARRFTRFHARWLPRYGTLIAMSERDAAQVRPLGAAVEVVPNGVASDELAALEPSVEPATLLFTGTLSHPPNAEGVRWLADAVWPLVRRARPQAQLLVVGRDPGRRLLELDGRAGIEVVGAVEEMSPWFARATAVVVPLRSGGGTRLKILEAFACRRAVVSTSVGCEGLDVSDGRELVVADAAEDFAAAIVRLLDDEALRDRLGASGRALAESRYDWRILGERLEAALGRLAGARSPA